MAYERTWAFSYNNPYTPTSAADQTKYQLWALKAMLLGQLGGLTLGLWTVDSSCDSVAAGNGDLVDRWGPTYDPSKIVRGVGGTPHSWFVLKSPLMNGLNFYLLITYNTGSNSTATAIMAKAPFIGGTNTANPTSTDSWTIGAGQPGWNNADSSGILNRFNIALSSVGDFIYFPVQAGQLSPNHATLCIGVVAPIGTHASDGYPIWAYRSFNILNVGGFQADKLFSTTGEAAKSSSGVTGNLNIIGFNTTTILQDRSPDPLTNRHMAMPCRVIVNFSTAWHLRGRLPDIMMISGIGTNSNLPKSGMTIRDNLNNVTHVLVGQLWIPCDGVVPIFS